ncbi:hypothetical protein K458DRAFT_442955 [Lentithecium fluviatile CBS 122367]|uniref:Uncharacterized protein n=1 Tax=Lentithecium fluviatile CBS 122367 TaxID=1168545 RepID=A0A6G1J358_9PLEO|nr:hypothetical protein K458DRAFT_442955 [Lentithecium fluviatile CBS 122367]
MSITTTTNTQNYNVRAVLVDYDLHHTPETSPRRIPPYRPVNGRLVQSEWRVFQNNVERSFVNDMFSGVFIEAAASKIWHATMGRVWDVGYAKGGKW